GANTPSGDATGPVLVRLLEEQQRLDVVARRGSTAQRLAALMQLERYDEAARMLGATSLDGPGSRTMGIIRQRQRRFAESDEFLHRALNSADENLQVEILDALAFNAHETGRYREAEHLYLDGIERLPGQAAYLHLQLGRHYHSGN